jgi:hypothetical protein
VDDRSAALSEADRGGARTAAISSNAPTVAQADLAPGDFGIVTAAAVHPEDGRDMAINPSVDVYLPVYDQWARPIVVFPVKSKPGMPPYNARGIYSTDTTNFMAEDGSIASDQKSICDVREAEFEVIPIQFDRVAIPASAAGPGLGEFLVKDASNNGGGETTLTLVKMEDERP